MENSTDRALKLFIVLSRSCKVILEEAHKLIEQYGLNPTEFGVLELLYHRGRQPIQKIGQKILLRSGSMTYVVDKLEKRGFLERVFCSEDKRVTYISITQSGVELIESIFPEHAKNIEALMSGLDAEEQNTAIDLLKKLGLSVKDLS
ncbi:MarR family transcriptional regulator [Sporosarcina sp. Marseille-Q4063]|uniref:MarR family winged helix-turn-helix transcriptional regulator n=1 Tax=Sporosarcina sp. Marseille-Q4063 TaxID=2810514 RepID=UPI001BAECA28|nr:MarR family transcriptional regulator [Sporosarcina sp. Marseille-Q4063]QUW21711.1 MarR family transcriptional regulator [Sporosarcina sp. Marseille-Q4063]